MLGTWCCMNSRNTDAPMCTCEDVLAYILGAPSIDDVMSCNSLTTLTWQMQSQWVCPLFELLAVLSHILQRSVKIIFNFLWIIKNAFLERKCEKLKSLRRQHSRRTRWGISVFNWLPQCLRSDPSKKATPIFNPWSKKPYVLLPQWILPVHLACRKTL